MEINVLEASGLAIDPNPLSGVLPGSLINSTNLDYDRLNVYEKTRGYKPYLTLSGKILKFFYYQGKTLVYYNKDNTTPTLGYDDGTAIIDYGAVANSYRMFATSANNNFYLTSDDGIRKLDSVTGELQPAGVPQGLGGTYTLISGSGNVVQTAHKTAYRIVWGYTDANRNLILSAPSPRIPVLNQSGFTSDVELTFQIPDQISETKYFYQIYRSLEVPDTTVPLDEMYLVDQINLTAQNILDGFIVYADHKTIDDLGATIYTAPSQKGIQNSYFQPPSAKDLGNFDGVNFYVNTKQRQFVILTLTQTQATGFGYFSITGDTTNGTFIVTNVSDTSGVQVGQSITGIGIPADTTVVSKTLTTITMSQAATADGVTIAITIRDYIKIGSEYYYASDVNDPVNRYFNVNTDIETATINLQNVVNQNSSAYNFYYLGIGEDALGQFEIEALDFDDPAFTVDASQPQAFIANLPQTSTNESQGNVVYFSLPYQPEAVPLGNRFEVGTSEFDIERFIALRDSYFFFLSDGSVWRGVGSTLETISIRRFNEKSRLRGIELPAILDNQIYCYCDRGVVAINDNGVTPIDYNIQKVLSRLSKKRNSTFINLSFGIGYETEQKYIMFVPTGMSDQMATQAYVYNTFTKGWTRWERDVCYGFWNQSEDLLYLGTNTISIERKNYEDTDFSEAEVDVSITAVSGQNVTLSSVAGIEVGWTLYQGIAPNQIKSKIQSITGNVVKVTRTVTFVVGVAKVYQPTEFSLSYVPQTYGTFRNQKMHQEICHYVQNIEFESFSQTLTNEDPSSPETNVVIPKSEANILQPIRTTVPRENGRSNWLNITISQFEACASFQYLGFTLSGDVVSERMK